MLARHIREGLKTGLALGSSAGWLVERVGLPLQGASRSRLLWAACASLPWIHFKGTS